MAKTMVAVRDVDEETFRKFRALSIEERMKVGDALVSAMNLWMRKRREDRMRKPGDMMKIKPVKIGGNKVRWSEEIEETLYG